MNATTTAELANTLAIAKIRSDIRWLEIVQAIPKYRDRLAVRRQWLFILTKRSEGLGEGARPRRKAEPQPVPLLGVVA